MRAHIEAVAAGALLAALAPSGIAYAAWPERSITIVVPFAAGGLTDVLARIAAERLSDRLKQPVIVENVLGATGTIAAARVARATPDGYTIFMATPSQISIAPFTHNINYDPLNDFAAVSVIATSPFVITVGAKLPANNLKEFIELAKSKPGEITYGSAGVGSLSHLTSAIFSKTAGVQMTHVPYKGVGPAFQDLIGGHIAMMAPSPVELKPFLGQGTLKPLGVTDKKRTKIMPDVPTLSEVLPSVPIVTWNGLLVPAKTPPDVIALLSKEIMLAEQDPAFLAKIEMIGMDPIVHTPQDFAALMAAETERWREVIKDLGLKASQ